MSLREICNDYFDDTFFEFLREFSLILLASFIIMISASYLLGGPGFSPQTLDQVARPQ